ncbi:MAG: hypothetical protein PHQ88_07485 [Bacteroides sp.]|nr:hypothetical protein [Bacteroides sp.]
MASEDIAQQLARKSLKYSNFEECLDSALAYLESLAIFKDIDIPEIIQLWALKDKRLTRGPLKEAVKLENHRFNPNGTVFLGRPKVKEIRDNGDYGILYLFGKGL